MLQWACFSGRLSPARLSPAPRAHRA